MQFKRFWPQTQMFPKALSYLINQPDKEPVKQKGNTDVKHVNTHTHLCGPVKLPPQTVAFHVRHCDR